MARKKLTTPSDGGPTKDIYLLRNDKDVKFFSSGDPVLDCVLGGGWAIGRIGNIVGDKSTGKTLLAIEGIANFKRQYPDGHVVYLEAEAAFDEGYAENLGMPVDEVEFRDDLFTVEDFYEDVTGILDAEAKAKTKNEILYVVDSLDALSDRAELDRKIDEGSFGTKAKQLSEIFRKIVKRMGQANMTLLVLSQVRDNIGVTFGRKVKRSGGHALDFYASQVLYIANKGAIYKTKNKVKRQIGNEIAIKCDKNKVGLAYRSCDVELIFGYGIDELMSMINYFEEVGKLDAVGITNINSYIKTLENLTDAEYAIELARLRQEVLVTWAEVERDFLPTRRKYNDDRT